MNCNVLKRKWNDMYRGATYYAAPYEIDNRIKTETN